MNYNSQHDDWFATDETISKDNNDTVLCDDDDDNREREKKRNSSFFRFDFFINFLHIWFHFISFHSITVECLRFTAVNYAFIFHLPFDPQKQNMKIMYKRLVALLHFRLQFQWMMMVIMSLDDCRGFLLERRKKKLRKIHRKDLWEEIQFNWALSQCLLFLLLIEFFENHKNYVSNKKKRHRPISQTI